MYKIGRVPRVSRGRKFKRVTRRLSKLTENKTTTSLSLSVSVSVARSHEGRIVNQKLREPAEKNRSEKKKRDKREREREKDAVEFGDGSGINHARCKLPELAASATLLFALLAAASRPTSFRRIYRRSRGGGGGAHSRAAR